MPIQVFGVPAAVIMLNRAFNDTSPGNLIYANQVAAATANLNGFANDFAASFASLSNADLASRVLGNLGLLPNDALRTALTDYYAANGAANRGLVTLQLANILTSLEGNATYGAAAAAWNDEVATGFTYSANTANTGSQTGTPSQTFTLTGNADSGPAFTGGAGSDTFNGVIGKTLATTDGTTFNPGDNLDGGAGNDTINVSIAGTIATAGDANVSAVTLNNIERMAINNYETSANDNTINLSNVTGLSSVVLVGSSATGDTLLTALKSLVTAEMNNGSGDLSLTYADAAVAGTADVQTLTVSGVTGGTFTAVGTTASLGGIETLAITSAGATKNVLTGITNDAALKTITVAGDQALNLGTLGAAVTKLDASANKGGITATLNATTTVVTGSSGNDSISTAAALTGAGAVDAGAGTDSLVLTADTHVNSSTLGAKFTNFETLNISSTQVIATAAGGGAAGNDWTDRSQDASVVAGITKVGLSTLSLTSNFVGDNTGNANIAVAFTNLPAAITDLTISGLSYTDAADTATDDDVALTVTASRKVDTTADALTVTLGTTTAAAGNAADATPEDALTLKVTLAGEETINIVSQGGANTITTLDATALKTLNASGSKALTITTVSNNTATSVINASGMTADFSIGANASTTASTITGGTGNDGLVGGSKADVIDGGAGSDTITGAAGADNLTGGDGNDVFLVGTNTDFQSMAVAESVDGGAGTDTLKFTADMTLVAADIAAVKNVETFEFNSAGANSITLSDAYFTFAGVTNLAIKDTENQAALTVTASALTAANSVTVTANSANGVNDALTGGAGNDSFTFTTKSHQAALDANDTVNGGKGTDTLTITLDTNNLTATTLTGVSNIERIVVTGSGALTAGLTLANSNFVTETVGGVTTTVVGVIDASGMVGNGGLTIDGVAETDSAMSITGGNGPDNLTGGGKADTIIGGADKDTLVGGAGVDSLDGGAGDDQFTVATLAHFVGLASPEVVIGGAGNDVLKFTANAVTAVNSTDLTSISGVETIEFNGNETSSITLTDAVFTANGASSLKITDTENTKALTVNAAALSAANSVSVSASVGADGAAQQDSLAGGSGNDTFTFTTKTSGTAFAAGDSVNGGAGTDTIAVVLDTTSLTGFTLSNVSNIERITVSGSAALNAGITIADANFVSVTGAVVDASAMTGTGALTLDAALEAESTFVITGGAGADNITGGQKADTINGGSGADTITGGAGADSLTGGNGADTFVYTNASVAHSSGSTIDTITDFATTSDKIQVTLSYSTLAAGVDVNTNFVTTAADLSAKRGELVYDSASGQLSININNDNLITTQDLRIGVGTVAAGDVNFNITGTGFGDTIVGGAGADTISGGAGADSITGGAGSDSITVADAGDSDVLVFSSAATNGIDTITGFVATANRDILSSRAITFSGGTAADTALNAADIAAADTVGEFADNVVAVIAANAQTIASWITAANAGDIDTTVWSRLLVLDGGTGVDKVSLYYVANTTTANDDSVTATLIGTFDDITSITGGTHFVSSNFDFIA